jgi:hypothetical protein
MATAASSSSSSLSVPSRRSSLIIPSTQPSVQPSARRALTVQYTTRISAASAATAQHLPAKSTNAARVKGGDGSGDGMSGGASKSSAGGGGGPDSIAALPAWRTSCKLAWLVKHLRRLRGVEPETKVVTALGCNVDLDCGPLPLFNLFISICYDIKTSFFQRLHHQKLIPLQFFLLIFVF